MKNNDKIIWHIIRCIVIVMLLIGMFISGIIEDISSEISCGIMAIFLLIIEVYEVHNV